MKATKYAVSIAAACLLWPALPASADVDNMGSVTAPINGVNTKIGTIAATVANAAGGQGSMSATFTFAPGQGVLDNAMCTFDWFQIVTSDPGPPPAYNGMVPKTSYVDPVFDGYDYQEPGEAQDVKNGVDNETGAQEKPGDDEAPYYLNAAEFAADHVQGTSVSISDTPGTLVIGNLAFATYLVERTPNYNAQTFDVLGGFTWGYNTAAGGGTTKAGPTFVNVGAGDVAGFQTALNNAFFDNTIWKTTTGRDLGPCLPVPETSTCASFGLLLGGLLLLGGRQARARRRA